MKIKPIDFTLTEQDKQILENAGDDRLKAVKSGVLYVGTDSVGIGIGLYAKADTVINSADVTYYKYLPNDSSSVYQVVFSFVGQGNGNYVQQSLYQYNFLGSNQGNYDTVIFIPVPNAYQVADLSLNYESSTRKEFTLNLESALSITDENKFSSLGDNNNQGVALYGNLAFNKNNLRLFGLNMNAVEFRLKEKLVNRVFVPLERYNPVEFYRQYDIQDSNKLTEDLHEASLRIAPTNFLNFNAEFGQLLRGDIFNSLRTVGEVVLTNDSMKLPDAAYKFELINADYSLANIKSRWIKQTGIVGYKKFIGGSSYENPNLRDQCRIQRGGPSK